VEVENDGSHDTPSDAVEEAVSSRPFAPTPSVPQPTELEAIGILPVVVAKFVNVPSVEVVERT